MTFDTAANLILFKMPCHKALRKRDVHVDAGGLDGKSFTDAQYRIYPAQAPHPAQALVQGADDNRAGPSNRNTALTRIVALQSKTAATARRHQKMAGVKFGYYPERNFT